MTSHDARQLSELAQLASRIESDASSILKRRGLVCDVRRIELAMTMLLAARREMLWAFVPEALPKTEAPEGAVVIW